MTLFGDMEGLVYLDITNKCPLPVVTQEEIRSAMRWQARPDRIHDGLYFELPNRARAARRAGAKARIADDLSGVRSAYERLREERLWVSLRDDGIRISPHVHNTPEDLERVRRALAG